MKKAIDVWVGIGMWVAYALLFFWALWIWTS
jgi:hypothetical protein